MPTIPTVTRAQTQPQAAPEPAGIPDAQPPAQAFAPAAGTAPAVAPPTPPVSPAETQAAAPGVNQGDYAGFTPRFFASMIDGFIVAVIYGLVSTIPSFLLSMVTGTSQDPGLALVSAIAGMALWVLGMAGVYAYWIYFTGKSGQTVGKKLLNIRVVDAATGRPPTYTHAFLREVIGKLLSSFLLLGYLWMLWDQRKQTWHDKIAGTVVVKA
ncbi:hypothetical protein A2Z33_02160 [Candidatus Gottesmanbacteria bacterium RBG_16_52_11]|uniref:RDD domain-containing protein n=1 Tax=Candidatus Gottesmanbacteria bacterium RBG_16_52_11 TaxID=1798374 RepID=A0A1F5YQU1_9BACT|nr:MAG: hypothetical protein A2Z33_02160 [Candidatus Gottesmanbacteria bacterium RBG_16_52_11]